MKNKHFFVHLIICVVLLVVVWGGYAVGSKKIDQRIDGIQSDNFSWVVQVDEVRIEKDQLVLEGFAFELNENTKEGAFRVILHNLDTGEYLFPKMEYKDRMDVNDYFLCEYDYTKSGFVAKIGEKKINLEEDYEVLLCPEETRKPYQFTTYLVDGKLAYVNPKEYVPLDVAGTELEELVEEGVLRVYRPDRGVYVYQVGKELYWLFESHERSVDESKYVQFQIGTTQPSKLPANRRDNNLLWGDMSFNFAGCKYDSGTEKKYRVTSATLPIEYSATWIAIGDFTDEWIWKQNFRPRYVFFDQSRYELFVCLDNNEY